MEQRGMSLRVRPARARRKRFLIVSAAGLAVLAAALGITFAGNTGTTTVSVGSSSTDFVFPVANGNPLPSASSAAIAALKYTPATGINTTPNPDVFSAAVLPSWSPVAGAAGSVTTAGDLAVIDARTATLGDHTALRVNMFVTNLDKLQPAYSSFAFPVNVYRCSTNTCAAADWQQASTVIASPPIFLTNTDGFLSFSLPAGFFYDITFDTGGSFYTISTSIPSNLNPQFFFNAQPT